MIGFNTQPHEGGCSRHCDRHFGQNGFNTQPHEGGCFLTANFQLFTKSFNTQPHEGGCRLPRKWRRNWDSFQHTAARRRLLTDFNTHCLSHCFNTQPHEGGCRLKTFHLSKPLMFQHTAARRRLQTGARLDYVAYGVSTHSRTKAAAHLTIYQHVNLYCFNTQPHEGGCLL